MSRIACLAIRPCAATGKPTVPAAWTISPMAAGWWVIYPLGREARPGVWFWARRYVSLPGGRGLFLLVGERAVLEPIAEASERVWTRAELRDSSDPLVVALRNEWLDERQPVYDAETGEPTGAYWGERIACYAIPAGVDLDLAFLTAEAPR